MKRPFTTLFMLMSVDGKISTGGTVNSLFLREKLFDAVDIGYCRCACFNRRKRHCDAD